MARVAVAFAAFNVAEWATWVAMLVYAYDRGGPIASGVVAIVQLIPAALFAPVGATLADRLPRVRILTIAPDTDVDEAAKMMAEFQVRRLPVVEDGRLLGIVVTAQLARRESKGEMGETIKEISEPASGRASHARG